MDSLTKAFEVWRWCTGWRMPRDDDTERGPSGSENGTDSDNADSGGDDYPEPIDTRAQKPRSTTVARCSQAGPQNQAGVCRVSVETPRQRILTPRVVAMTNVISVAVVLHYSGISRLGTGYREQSRYHSSTVRDSRTVEPRLIINLQNPLDLERLLMRWRLLANRQHNARVQCGRPEPLVDFLARFTKS